MTSNSVDRIIKAIEKNSKHSVFICKQNSNNWFNAYFQGFILARIFLFLNDKKFCLI